MELHPGSVTSICILLLLAFVVRQSFLRWNQSSIDSRFGEQQGCKPPTWQLPCDIPWGVDVVVQGFAAARRKQLLQFMTGYFEATGPTIQINLLGGKGFATMDPENIEAVLSSQFEDFHLGPRSLGFRTLVGDSILTQDDQAWKRSRETLRHRFTQMHYQNLKGFQEHVDRLLANIRRDVASESGLVNLQPLFYRMTLETTVSVIIGNSIDEFQHEEGDQFSSAFTYATLVTATRVRLGDNYWLYAPKGFFAACNRVKSYTERFVRTALSQNSQQESLIQDLKEEFQDEKVVRDHVVSVLLAGRDTTATAMSYVFRFLTRHPKIFEKLRAEISTTLGEDPEVTRAHIQRMPYLRAVINETMRLRPPVPLNSRFCRRTTTLPRGGGADGSSPILIREGDAVAFAPYHMHRRTDIWGPDALEFKPERWEDPSLPDVKWAFLPFNGGPRICLGKDFGTMLASYSIICIIQAFPDIRLAPGEDTDVFLEERQNVSLVLSTPDGCRVKIGGNAE